MLITPNRRDLNTIVILNPKGGCGKTTLATNIASFYAKQGPMPALMDCDPQGSSMRWLDKREAAQPPIHGIAAYKKSMQATRSWQLRVPNETKNLIVDSPASLTHDDLRALTGDATSILVPVLPSSIDIHAASRAVADLLLVAKVDRRDNKLAVVANRTRQNTKSFDKLMRFLSSLGIPIIAVMRDSQNFVHASEEGVGIVDMPGYKVQKDLDELQKVIDWLDSWPNRRRDLHDTGVSNKPAGNVTVLHNPLINSG
ncbi:MAG: AAA family ATPase [Gammaproteobacteria bacterium]|nr:AAA family ATPase [Gammaproteobacteria bacterium]MDH5308765.1 AAA family ATPase [Gammaproteobacteria bacterium]